MKHLMSALLIIIFVYGCSRYGEISQDTIYLNFPIKVSLDKMEGDWKLDYTLADYPGSFDLVIRDIKKIKINDYIIDGNFTARLRNIGDVAYKEGDYYYFSRLVINTSEESMDSVYKKLITQNVINYADFCDGTWTIIDMENFIRYFLYESGEIRIGDIKIIYEDRLH